VNRLDVKQSKKSRRRRWREKCRIEGSVDQNFKSNLFEFNQVKIIALDDEEKKNNCTTFHHKFLMSTLTFNGNYFCLPFTTLITQTLKMNGEGIYFINFTR
jgi:hypothetical protein